jgi:hypothetical protein
MLEKGTDVTQQKNGSPGKRALKIILVIILVTILIAALWVKQTLYAGTFTPVALGSDEQKVLNKKLALLNTADGPSSVSRSNKSIPKTSLEPEPYSEAGARRELLFTERELNSLIAEDRGIAERAAIDLSKDLVSVKLVIPVDEEFPLLGGKTLKFHLGLIIRFKDRRPVVALKGISLGGVPLPNAWLGYLKNKNLVEEFGDENGFWKIFSEGVQDIQVGDGYLRITLKE